VALVEDPEAAARAVAETAVAEEAVG